MGVIKVTSLKEKLKKGDVIVFVQASREPIIHRIVGIRQDEEKLFWTINLFLFFAEQLLETRAFSPCLTLSVFIYQTQKNFCQ